MDVRQATHQDIDIIMDIIEEARAIMRESGNMTQWSDGYPSRRVILEDIANKHAFVCINGDDVVGYFCFMAGEAPDPNYRIIEGGSWLDNALYGVIHRLASGRKAKGIAKTAFDFAFSKINNVRLNTHHENIPMQNYLKKSGFTYCGIIYVSDGTPRDAFQKQLPQ